MHWKQAAIQHKLSDYGYSEDDDPVMAEYVTVMLANNKSAAQITGELSELIGTDYDSAFTDWLYAEAIPSHYAPAGSSGSANKSATSAASNGANINSPPSSAKTELSSSGRQGEQQRQGPASIQTVGDSREPRQILGRGGRGGQRSSMGNGRDNDRRPNQREAGGSGVFGNAMAGLKRGGDRDGADRPNRRQRMSDQGGSNDAEMQDDRPKQRSIFDRAGVRAGTAQPFNPGQQQQNGVSDSRNSRHNMTADLDSSLQRGRRQQQGSGPMSPGMAMPFGQIPSIPGMPMLRIPDNFNSLPLAQQQAIQQQIFQHQLIATAAAQQMMAGSQQQHQYASGPAMGGLNPQAMAFDGMQVDQPRQRKPSKPVVLPSKPTSEELCKYGVDCKNAVCRYSHPSPSATRESGLVLSKDICDKGKGGLACEDRDCPKSHVSPAQKTDPQGLNAHQYKQKAANGGDVAMATSPTTAAPPAGAVAAANAGAKPCMYGANCTRPGCFFAHPPAPSQTACYFGLGCTRGTMARLMYLALR